MTKSFKIPLPRDANEAHRAASPLELLFDLVSVIAIAWTVAGLHHAVSAHHAIDGIISYGLGFFVIWWAWMNYTWYASAYDNDDTVFRLLTMVAMAGSLVIAAGVEPFFDSGDATVFFAGYVIMRIAMVILWLRAAKHDPQGRKTALTYAAGIAIAQVYWLSLLIFPEKSQAMYYGLFGLGMAIELFVPFMAERKGSTPWHRDHITERYGLLFIIVMGELLLGGALALKAVYPSFTNLNLMTVAVSSLLIAFSMWWLYFSDEDHLDAQNLSLSRLWGWGYGHIFVFASAAAVGGGLAVFVDVYTDHAKVGVETAAKAVAIPLILYFISLWFIRDRFVLSGAAKWVLPIFAALLAAASLSPKPLETITLLAILSVIARNSLAARQAPQA